MTEPSNTVNAITSFNLEYTTIKLPSKVRRLSSLSQDAQDCLCEDKVVDEEYQFPGNWDTGPEELAMFFKPKAINKVGNYNYWYYGYMWYSFYGYYYNPNNGTPTPSLNSDTGWFKTGSTLFDFNPSFKYNDVPSPEYAKIVLNKTANVFEEYSDIPSLYFYSTSPIKHYGVKKEIQRKCWAGRGTLGSDEVIVIVSPFGGLYQTQRKFYSELSYAYFDSTSSTYTYVICYLNSKSGIFPPGDLCENPYCVVSVGFFGGGYSDSFGLAYPTFVNEGFYWNNASNSGFSTYYFDSTSSRQTFKSVNNTVNETTSFTSQANEIPFLYSFTSPLTISASGSISGPAYYNSEYTEVIAGKQYIRTSGNFLYEFDPLFASLPSKAFFWSFSSNFVNYLNSTLYGNTCVAGRPILIEKEESEGSYGSLKTVPTGHPLTGSVTTGSAFEEFWWQSIFQPLSVEYPAFAGASPCTYPFTTPPPPNFKQWVLTPFMTGSASDSNGPLPDVPLAAYDHIGKHVFSVNGDGSEYYSIITEEQNLEQGAGLDGTSSVCITANSANPPQCGFPSQYYSWGNATVRVRLNGTLKAKLYKRQYFNPPYYFPQTKVVVEDLDPPYYKAHRSDFKSQLYWHPVDTSGSYETYYKPSDAVVSYKVIGTDEKITLPFPLYNRALSYYSNIYSGNYTNYCQNYWLPILSTRKIKSKVLFSQFALEGLIPNGGFKYPSNLTDAMVRIYPVPIPNIPTPPVPPATSTAVTTIPDFDLDEVSDSSYPQYFYLASDFSKLVAYKFPVSAYKNIYAMTLYATYGYSYMPSSFLNLKQAVKLDEFKLIPQSSPLEFYTSVVQQSEANQALYHLAKLSNSIAYAPSVLGWYYNQGWYNPYGWAGSNYLTSIFSEIDFKGLKDYYNNMYASVGKSTVGILFDKDRGPVQTFMTEPYLWSTLGIGGDASNFQNNKDALSWIKNLSIPEQKSSFYLLDNSVYLEAGTLVLDTFTDRVRSDLCWIYQGVYSTPYNTSQINQIYPVSYFGTRGFHDTLSIENHQMVECSTVSNGVGTNGPPMTTGSESGRVGYVKIGLSYSLKNPKEIADHIAAVYKQASDSYSAKMSAAAPYLIYYWAGYYYYGYNGVSVDSITAYPVYATACDFFYHDALPHTRSPVTVNTGVQFIYPSGSNSSYTSVNDYQYGWRSTTTAASGSFTNQLCTVLGIKVKMEPNVLPIPGYINLTATGTYFPKSDPILEQKFLCDSLSGLSIQSTTIERPNGFHTAPSSYGGYYAWFNNYSNDYRNQGTINLSYYNIAMLNNFSYFASPVGLVPGFGNNPKIADPDFKGDAALHLEQGSFNFFTPYASQVKYNVDMAPIPYPNLHPNPVPYPDTNSYNQPIISFMGYPGMPNCYTSSANAYPGSTGYCTNTGNSVSYLRSSCNPYDPWNPGCNYTTHYDGTKIYESEYNCESNVNACNLGHSKEFIHNWFNPPAIPPIDYVIRFGFEHTGSV